MEPVRPGGKRLVSIKPTTCLSHNACALGWPPPVGRGAPSEREKARYAMKRAESGGLEKQFALATRLRTPKMGKQKPLRQRFARGGTHVAVDALDLGLGPDPVRLGRPKMAKKAEVPF